MKEQEKLMRLIEISFEGYLKEISAKESYAGSHYFGMLEKIYWYTVDTFSNNSAMLHFIQQLNNNRSTWKYVRNEY